MKLWTVTGQNDARKECYWIDRSWYGQLLNRLTQIWTFIGQTIQIWAATGQTEAGMDSYWIDEAGMDIYWIE